MKSSIPTVSVVVPTHNRPSLLCRTLESIEQQTLRDFEVIVVDDHSPTPVDEVVRHFSGVTLIRHDRNRGGPAARNTGIHAARGVYVALIDDDDTWEPKKLEEQVRTLEEAEPEVGLCYTWCDAVDDATGQILFEFRATHQGRPLEPLLKECFLGSSTVMIKRESFRRVGVFDESFVSCQDWEMWVRIATQYAFVCIPRVLAHFHHHGGSRTGTSTRALEGYAQFAAKFAPLYKGREKAFGQLLEFIGYSYLRNGDYLSAVRFLHKSLAFWPWSWKCWLKCVWATYRVRSASAPTKDSRKGSPLLRGRQ